MAGAIRQVFEFATRVTGGLDDIREDIEQTANAVDDLGDESDETSKQSGKAEKGLMSIGKAAKIALAAITAFAGFQIAKQAVMAVYDSVVELDTAMNTFEAQTGLTGDALAEYRDIAESVFKAGWGENFTAVSAAMAQVRNITQASGDDLGVLTEKALIMQGVFGKDINESVGTANTLMETFGISGAYAFDLITNGLQKTGDPTGTLLDAMNEFAPVFKDMGFGASEMLSIIETGMAGGARDAQVLGQAMTEFNAKLKDGSAETAIWEMGLGDLNYQFVRGEASGEDMLTAVLDGLRKIDDPLERSRLGTQLFGEKWNEVGEQALLAMDTAGEGLRDVIGATDRAGKAMQRGPRQAWERFTRTVQIGLSDALGPYIEKGLLVAISALERMGAWIEGTGIPALSAFAGWIDQTGALDAVASAADWLSDTLSGLSPESITLIAVALGAMAAPAIASGILGVIGAVGGMAGAIGGAVLAAAPLLLIFGVIAAYESNFGGLRDKIGDIREDFKSGDIDGGFQNIAEALISIPKGIVAEVIDPLVKPDLKGGLAAWDGIAKNLGIIKDALPGFIGSKLDSLGQDLEDKLVTPFKDKVGSVKDFLIGDGVGSLRNVIRYVPAGLMSWLGDLPGQIYDKLGRPFEGEIGKVKGLLTGEGLNSLKSVIRYVPAGLISWLADLPGQIGNFLSLPFEDKIAIVKGLITGDGVDSLKAALSIGGQLPTWLGDLPTDLLNLLQTPFTTAIGAMISLVTGDEEGSFKLMLMGLPDKILEWVGDIAAPGIQLGKAFLDGMMGVLKGLPGQFIQIINDAIPNEIDLGTIDVLGYKKHIVVDIPDNPIPIPAFERGGWAQGLSVFGEGGPELGFVHQPTAILSHDRSVRAIQDAFGLSPVTAGGAYNFYGGITLNGINNPRRFLKELDREARRQNKTLTTKGRKNP